MTTTTICRSFVSASAVALRANSRTVVLLLLLALNLGLAAGSASALDVNVTNYSWLQLPHDAVTPIFGSDDNTVGSSFGDTNSFRWGDYVWLPSNGMTSGGTQMYYAGLQFDQPRNVTSVNLQWFAVSQNVSGYYIDGTTDGTNWDNIAIGGPIPGAGPTSTLHNTTDAVTPGDYLAVRVRLEGSQYTTGAGYFGPGWTLIEPVGNGIVSGDQVNWANVQLGTSVTNNGFVASYNSTLHNNGAYEEIRTTARWTGSAGTSWTGGAYTQVDLGDERLIDSSTALWSDTYWGTNYDMEYSVDGVNFFPITGKTVSNPAPTHQNGVTILGFDPVIARYMRMSNASGGTGSHVLINQLSLHSPEEGTLASNPGENGTITINNGAPNQTVTLTDAIQLENTGDAGTYIGIFDYEITGIDAAAFDLSNFAPMILASGDSALFDLELATPGGDVYNAILTFNTSLGDLTFNLQSAQVPEPNSALLLGLGLIGITTRIRRRRK